jgi:hypothetical protein
MNRIRNQAGLRIRHGTSWRTPLLQVQVSTSRRTPVRTWRGGSRFPDRLFFASGARMTQAESATASTQGEPPDMQFIG